MIARTLPEIAMRQNFSFVRAGGFDKRKLGAVEMNLDLHHVSDHSKSVPVESYLIHDIVHIELVCMLRREVPVVVQIQILFLVVSHNCGNCEIDFLVAHRHFVSCHRFVVNVLLVTPALYSTASDLSLAQNLHLSCGR